MDKPQSRNNYDTTNRPIGWFVAFSLLLHALLFWGVIHHQNATTPVPSPQQAAGGLHISLMPYRVPTQKSTPEQREKKNVTRQVANNATHTVSETTKQQTEKHRDTDASFREQIMVKLRQSLAAHFVYPLLARQRNWQGEVLLAFRLERDGRISEVRVAHSSGYSLLDHAALSALDKVGRISEILPRTLTVELPVIYRLES